jgi:hypothetical protein
MPNYRVKPGPGVNQNGEIKREGDVIEVARHVAYELRGQLEPVDEEGKFPEVPNAASVMQAGMRAHERLSVLKIQREDLEKQLKLVDTQIEAETRKAKEETDAKRKRPTPPDSKQPEQPAQEA